MNNRLVNVFTAAKMNTYFADLNQAYGLIAVSGPKTLAFLQGQLTCDMRTITTSAPGFGAFCNPKGRIRALFRIFLYEENYYLQLPRLLLPKTLAQLQQYARFSKITLEDVSDTWSRLGIWGTDIMTKLPKDDTIVTLILPSTNTNTRAELLGPTALLQPITTYLSQQAKQASFEAWKRLDIQAGIPEIWPETTEQLLPHYINLPALGGVSFNKGCYCGQEIIARMEYRAALKRGMFQAFLPGNTSWVPLPGTVLWRHAEKDSPGNPEPVGTIISASPAEKGTELLIETLTEFVQHNRSLAIYDNNNLWVINIQ